MKIERIEIENFLGVRRLDLPLRAPGVTLIAGHNGAGKSSVRDAIRFALTGEPGRVRLKKDYGALLSAGAKDGRVAITVDGTRVVRSVKTGNLVASGIDLPEGLPYVLDADRFARLDGKQRRRLLMAIAGVEVTRDTVRKRLIERGCDGHRVDAVLPLLRQGFDAAAQEAAGRAREAKGAWRHVTGENWGKAKADDWRPAMPEGVPEDADLDALNKINRALLDEESRVRADLNTRRRLARMTGDQDERIGHATAIHTAIEDAEQAIEYWQTEVARLEALAQSGGGLLTRFTCPDCGAEHRVRVSRGEIEVVPDDMDDPAAQRELTEAREKLDEAQKAHAKLTADLARQQAAAEARQVLRDLPSEAELEAKLKSLEEDTSKIGAQIAAVIEARKAAETARQAEIIHQDVLAWLSIAEALSPDGIPAELTGEALTTANEQLEDLAKVAGWSVPRIGHDMGITIDGRPYDLLSESEQWRANAVIAAAIALQADLRLLVLDRMDVLDLPSRGSAIKWLDWLARTREMQAIVMATLKAPPAKLPKHTTAVWIDGGAIKNAAQAA